MGNSSDRLTAAFAASVLLVLLCKQPGMRGSTAVESAAMIPLGTIIPVRLDKPISVKDAKRGQAVEAKVAQTVPLPDGEKIAFRATVKGSIVSVETDRDSPGMKITFKFDQLEEHKEAIPIVTYLRAMASFRAVQSSLVREITITTTLVGTRDAVEISVSDTGHGVTQESKERLFLPYFSTKKRGTGLGLAIVSRIVEDHHGSIRVEENRPVGARFVVELPVATEGMGTVDVSQHA